LPNPSELRAAAPSRIPATARLIVLGARDYQGGITILVAAPFVSTSHQKTLLHANCSLLCSCREDVNEGQPLLGDTAGIVDDCFSSIRRSRGLWLLQTTLALARRGLL
jgi:hypothetical protein